MLRCMLQSYLTASNRGTRKLHKRSIIATHPLPSFLQLHRDFILPPGGAKRDVPLTTTAAFKHCHFCRATPSSRRYVSFQSLPDTFVRPYISHPNIGQGLGTMHVARGAPMTMIDAKDPRSNTLALYRFHG